jgi:hypothetical protein
MSDKMCCQAWNIQSEQVLMDLNDKKDMHKRAIVSMDILPHLNCLASGYLTSHFHLSHRSFKYSPYFVEIYVGDWTGRSSYGT